MIKFIENMLETVRYVFSGSEILPLFYCFYKFFNVKH